MKRRTALKALCLLIALPFAKQVQAEGKPLELLIAEIDIKNITIIKEDNSELVIPFSEIVKALEDD